MTLRFYLPHCAGAASSPDRCVSSPRVESEIGEEAGELEYVDMPAKLATGAMVMRRRIDLENSGISTRLVMGLQGVIRVVTEIYNPFHITSLNSING